ncbi:MAG: tRNA adenosine(34) deaminase TadA [Phycisphaerae bacterium]
MQLDRYFMNLAMEEARYAASIGEVPVGAVIVRLPTGAEPMVVAKSHNQRELLHDPTAHAEILALRMAGEKLGNWQLIDCDLYVTLEPCPMCAGALVNARIRRIIFGCRDPKAGAVGSLYNLPADGRFNHRPQILEGVQAQDAARLLKEFFAARRKNPRPG